MPQTDKCNVCKEVDGVEHHLFDCVDSKLFGKGKGLDDK